MNKMENIPQIVPSAHTHSIYTGNEMAGHSHNFQNVSTASLLKNQHASAFAQQASSNLIPGLKELHMTSRRLVQVIIVDPNENVPMADCLLFKGEEKLTDATDQELFFEIDIRTLLERHNIKRVRILDKKVKDRSEFLEPAKIRDLKMVVVNIAQF